MSRVASKWFRLPLVRALKQRGIVLPIGDIGFEPSIPLPEVFDSAASLDAMQAAVPVAEIQHFALPISLFGSGAGRVDRLAMLKNPSIMVVLVTMWGLPLGWWPFSVWLLLPIGTVLLVHRLCRQAYPTRMRLMGEVLEYHDSMPWWGARQSWRLNLQHAKELPRFISNNQWRLLMDDVRLECPSTDGGRRLFISPWFWEEADANGVIRMPKTSTETSTSARWNSRPLIQALKKQGTPLPILDDLPFQSPKQIGASADFVWTILGFLLLCVPTLIYLFETLNYQWIDGAPWGLAAVTALTVGLIWGWLEVQWFGLIKPLTNRWASSSSAPRARFSAIKTGSLVAVATVFCFPILWSAWAIQQPAHLVRYALASHAPLLQAVSGPENITLYPDISLSDQPRLSKALAKASAALPAGESPSILLELHSFGDHYWLMKRPWDPNREADAETENSQNK